MMRSVCIEKRSDVEVEVELDEVVVELGTGTGATYFLQTCMFATA